jgi:type I restriction enzyme S subunit
MNKKIKLKELCIEDEWGKYGIPASAEKFDINKTRYLRITDISEDGELLNNDIKSVSAPDIDKYILKEGDIVFARTGNSTGKSYYHESKNGDLAFAGFLIRYSLDKTKINPKYLKFFTITNEYKTWVKNLSVGSTRGNINAQTFGDCPISVPERKQQDLLVSSLSLIIDKIELNNRINAELESMAKTLYDYWFVQFDFPDKNGNPYKTSGGKMVWNDELKREIPEGFLDSKLGDVLASTGTGLNPRDNFVLGEGKNFYVTIKNIEQGRVILDNRCDRISDDSLEIINKRSDLKIGDILFTSIEPVGITYLILEKPKNWNINESVFTIRPNYEKVTSEFLYMFLSGDYIKSYTKNVSAGSIHKGVRHGVLKDCKFMLPKRNTVDAFTKKIQPMLMKLDLIQKENQKLTELRDWLLPMLMNGQVKVG